MFVRIALISLVMVLTACHDSDTGSSGSGSPSSPPASSSGTARVVINFPVSNSTPSGVSRFKTMLSALGPVVHSYVSPKTQSVSVSLTSVNGATPTTPAATIVNVVAGSDCVAGSGVLTCTISIDAPVGNDGLEVETYAQANAVGGALSIGDTTIAITSGATADASVDLLPVIASVSVSLNPASLPITTAGTFTATIVAKDVAGDVIGGTDNYYQPLTFTTSDSGAHVTSSPALPATFTSPAQNTITFTYDGAGSAASFSFVIGGATSQTVSFAFSSNVEHLYVVGQFSPAAVFVYDIQPDGSVTGPSRTISGSNTTLNRPTSLAVDTLGQLYVVNYGTYPLQGDNVAVFAPGADGNVAPIQTLLQGSQPFYVSKGALAFLLRSTTDSPDDVSVVLNYGTSNPISSSGLSDEIPPFVDEWATSFASYIDDADNGFLCATTVVPEDGGLGWVGCFTSPVLYVTNPVGPTNAQIVNGRANTNYEFGGGSPNGLAFLPNGQLMVAYGSSYNQDTAVKTFVMPGDPATAISTQPILSITGSNTGLISPYSIAFDKNGNTFVCDAGDATDNGAIRIFAPKADGNVAPLHQITGLNAPFSIAIGK
jgi:hypothetical protein